MESFKAIFFEELDSTNRFAMTNIADLEDKTVIFAAKQTDGYGRFKRKWVSDNANNLYCSIVLKPSQRSPVANLTQYMSVIICEALETYGVNAEIKWPNDVLVNNKKIAGILSEASVRGKTLKGLVLGVGVNLNFSSYDLEKIDQPATALNLEIDKLIDVREFSDKLIEAFFKEYGSFMESGFEYIKHRYISRCSFLGKEISVKNFDTQQSGIASAINDDGTLLLETANKYQTIRIGDLQF